MKIVVFILAFLFWLTSTVDAQCSINERFSTTIHIGELHFGNHYGSDFKPEHTLSANDYPIGITRSPHNFNLIIPDKLPMFCALEKKLTDLCNVWIKIRLPERD